MNTNPNNVVEIKLNSGETGRIWQISEHKFGWAHPDGSQGDAPTFEAAEAELESIP